MKEAEIIMFGQFFGISIIVVCSVFSYYIFLDNLKLTKQAFRDGLFDDDYSYDEESEVEYD